MNKTLQELIDKYIDSFLSQEEIKQYFVLEKQIEESEEVNFLRETLKNSQKELALSITDDKLHKIKLAEYNNAKKNFEEHPLVCNYNLIKEKIYNQIKSLEEKIKD